MKLKVSPWRMVMFIGAVVPMLIAGLKAPRAGAPGIHRRAVDQVITSHCRIAGSGCNLGMKPRLHDNPLIPDLMTSAIWIVDHV